MNPYICN